MQNRITKQRKVINHLTAGKSLTPTQARTKFGIKNLRATISSIRDLVEQYGNWEVVNEDGSYRMFDTHSGKRTYQFTPSGRRTMIA